MKLGLQAHPGTSRFAAFAGDTETWIDAAAPTVAEAEKLHQLYATAPDLAEALEALVQQFDTAWSKEGISCGDISKARAALQKAGVTL